MFEIQSTLTVPTKLPDIQQPVSTDAAPTVKDSISVHTSYAVLFGKIITTISSVNKNYLNPYSDMAKLSTEVFGKFNSILQKALAEVITAAGDGSSISFNKTKWEQACEAFNNYIQSVPGVELPFLKKDYLNVTQEQAEQIANDLKPCFVVTIPPDNLKEALGKYVLQGVDDTVEGRDHIGRVIYGLMTNGFSDTALYNVLSNNFELKRQFTDVGFPVSDEQVRQYLIDKYSEALSNTDIDDATIMEIFYNDPNATAVLDHTAWDAVYHLMPTGTDKAGSDIRTVSTAEYQAFNAALNTFGNTLQNNSQMSVTLYNQAFNNQATAVKALSSLIGTCTDSAKEFFKGF